MTGGPPIHDRPRARRRLGRGPCRQHHGLAGRTSYFHDELDWWEQYAFDPREKPKVGKRSREWTAIGKTEVECVREMAYCLRELREGRWPK